ncbi:hypothetical protein, partial [Peribacillus muralis]|uniref:hypothetical protein n=1 Tax=Peribacillus muralis TaxID=264697 RepID=UPI001F318132
EFRAFIREFGAFIREFCAFIREFGAFTREFGFHIEFKAVSRYLCVFHAQMGPFLVNFLLFSRVWPGSP